MIKMALIVLLLVVAAILGLLVMLYNRLVALRQNVNQGSADIDVQLRQRHDLIPNLVSAVKGYAAHERETLDAVIAARNSAEAGRGGNAAAETALGNALGKLFALAEAYPDLKANTNFLSLQGELADVEDKLAAARRALNSATTQYNAYRESFPAILIANMFGFAPMAFERIGESEQHVSAAPTVQF